MKYLGFYRKWIKGDCRHLCILCKHKKLCAEQQLDEERVKKDLDEFRKHITYRFNNIK